MRKRAAWFIGTVIMVTLVQFAPQQQALADDSGPIIVIVNVANPLHDVSLAQLRKIFLSDVTQWENGKPVNPVIPTAGTPVRSAFLRIVCGMKDADFRKYFLQAAFTGKNLTAPQEVNTTAELKSIVSSSPGAIGFIRAIDFHGDGSDGGIKAVQVNGFLASDPGYKLRM